MQQSHCDLKTVCLPVSADPSVLLACVLSYQLSSEGLVQALAAMAQLLLYYAILAKDGWFNRDWILIVA